MRVVFQWQNRSEKATTVDKNAENLEPALPWGRETVWAVENESNLQTIKPRRYVIISFTQMEHPRVRRHSPALAPQVQIVKPEDSCVLRPNCNLSLTG